MCNSLKERKTKRDAVLALIGVTQRDKSGKAKVLVVPGSNGSQYRVILRREGRVISAECAQIIGALGHRTCKGNTCCKTLCYHSMAAIEFAVREGGFKGHWSDSQAKVQKLHTMLGGMIFEAKSFDGNGRAFILVTKEQ